MALYGFTTLTATPKNPTSATAMTVGDTDEWPDAPFYLMVKREGQRPRGSNSECVLVTAYSGSSVSAMTRTQVAYGTQTTALSLQAGDQCYPLFIPQTPYILVDGLFYPETATGINAAEAAAFAAGIRDVVLRNGTIDIDAMIDHHYKNVFLRGAGEGWTNEADSATGTRLRWTGAPGGYMVDFGAADGALYALSTAGITGIHLDANGIAVSPLRLRSLRNCDVDVTIKGVAGKYGISWDRTASIDIGALDVSGSQFNRIKAATNNGGGMTVLSDIGILSLNDFWLRITHDDLKGIDWVNCDSNHFHTLVIATGNAKVTTFSLANPCVATTATAHGKVAGDTVRFSTTGRLPSGPIVERLVPGRDYYVLAAGLGATTMEIAETVGGTAISTASGDQYGTHYLVGAIGFHNRGAVTGGTSTVVTIANGAAAQVAHTAHGKAANLSTSFTTTGALPAPLQPGVVYYVKTVVDADHYTLSRVPGGTVIATTTAGSGTHSNPNGFGIYSNANTFVDADFGPGGYVQTFYSGGTAPHVFDYIDYYNGGVKPYIEMGTVSKRPTGAGFAVSRATAQPIPNNVITPIVFTEVSQNPVFLSNTGTGMYVPATGTWTLPYAGWWNITCRAEWTKGNPEAVGKLYELILFQGGVQKDAAYTQTEVADTGAGFTLLVSGEYHLDPADGSVVMGAYQNSGADRNINNSANAALCYWNVQNVSRD